MNVARIRTHIRRRFIVILLWGTALTNYVDGLPCHGGAAQESTPPSGATKRRRYALYDAGASPISDRLPGPGFARGICPACPRAVPDRPDQAECSIRARGRRPVSLPRISGGAHARRVL